MGDRMKKSLLIVEDDEDFQSLYKDILLAELDIDICQAYNGLEALKWIEKKKPDLIILDMLMPVMDGERFFKVLRQERNVHDIPVIIASVNDQAGEALAKLNNIRAIFKKPFPYHAFLAKIKEVLGLAMEEPPQV